MRKTIMTSALLATGLVAPAMADGRDKRCSPGIDDHVVAASDVRRRLEDLGYRVDRVEAEHGCYEIRAVNDSGFPIKAVYVRATGELVRARLR
ncbi:PepSY domain-containing protein [Microvirga sp. G4-2]|uniref:PepSY domain-containing protein n=1 Tax=Microvirga sp. G4-2 TaxID=3434467 RepID=UPI0040442B65